LAVYRITYKNDFYEGKPARNFAANMSEFYKELKELRENQGIDLEEIHNRTKISLDYLRAIEDGRFDLLPHTYIRLFIRAYATEVGVEPEDILNNLENYLGNKSAKPANDKPKKEDPPPQEEKTQLSEDDKAALSQTRSAKNIRLDMIKGIILVFILIFAIYIIRIINAEEAAKTPIEFPSEFLDEGSISELDLQNNFDVLSESIQILEAEPPYNLKLATGERVWYRIMTDTLNSSEFVLPSGDNRIYEFSQMIDILFKHTRGLNLYLNGSALNSFDSSSNPVRVFLSAVEKTVTIQHFVPKS